MIWKTIHLADGLKNTLNEQRAKQENSSSESLTTCVAIVGGGPKGMYALDTLLRKIAESEDNPPLTIDWYNKDANFGSGPNYDVTQADNLLINYAIGNINAWQQNDVSRLSLTDWIAKHLADPQPVSPYDFASRALVGYYLKDCCRTILTQAPQQVSLNLIVHAVEDLEAVGEQLMINDKLYDSVILCTGHSYANKFMKDTDDSLPTYEAYPASGLDQLKGAKKIAIQGMGLSFIDTVITLSEQQNGTDAELPMLDNSPTFYPYSRTNLPMLPRAAQITKNEPSFLFPQYWEQIMDKAQIDFDTEIAPMLDEEISYAYYSKLAQSDELEAVLLRIAEEPAEDHFSMHRLLFPNQYLSENELADYNSWVLHYLKEHVDRCERAADDALSAALAKLAQFRKLIESCYAFGKLTPASHERFDKYWYPAISRVSFGPPIANVKKVIKLMEADKLQFRFSESPEVELSEGQVLLKGQGQQVECDALIYAMIPKADLLNTPHPLYSNLLARGLATTFSNGNYATGTVAISEQARLIGVDGGQLPLFAYGTPTEGCVLDNDSLSRNTHNFLGYWLAQLKHIMNTSTKNTA